MANSVQIAKRRIAPALAQPPKRAPNVDPSRLAVPEVLREIVGAAGFHDVNAECASFAPYQTCSRNIPLHILSHNPRLLGNARRSCKEAGDMPWKEVPRMSGKKKLQGVEIQRSACYSR